MISQNTHQGIGLATFALVVATIAGGCTRSAPLNSVDDSEALRHIGEETAVRGVIVSVFVSKAGNAFLNFGKPYPHQSFTAVIFRSSASAFENPRQLEGRTVIVRGIVKMYKGRPQIILESPSQLTVVD